MEKEKFNYCERCGYLLGVWRSNLKKEKNK